MSTQMLETTEIESFVLPYDESDADPDHKTHIVSPPENRHITGNVDMEAQDIVDIARAVGYEVVALCGHRWVPKRNPEKYDMCQQCIDIAGMIMRDLGE